MSVPDAPTPREVEELATLLDAAPTPGGGPAAGASPLAATVAAVRAGNPPAAPSPAFRATLKGHVMRSAVSPPLAPTLNGHLPRPVAAPLSAPMPPRTMRHPLPATGRRRGLAEFVSFAALIGLIAAIFGQTLGPGGNLAFWQDAATPTRTPVTTEVTTPTDPTSGLERGDSGRTGSYAGTGPAGVPGVRWSVDLGDSAYRQPVAVDGALFLADLARGEIVKLGDDGSRMPGVDLLDLHSYVVGDGTVFVAAQRDTGTEFSGVLAAYGDGATVPDWSIEIEPSAAVLGYDGDRLYLADTAGVLRAFDAVDGTEIWKVDLEVGSVDTLFQPPSSHTHNASPAIGGGLLVVSTPAGEVRAFDAFDGAPRWTFDVPENRLGAPTIADGTVYVAAREAGSIDGGHVYALDATDGAKRWEYALTPWDGDVGPDGNLPLEDALTLTTDGDHVFVNGDGAAGDAVTAIDAGSGEVVWSERFDAAGGSAPTVAGGTLYLTRPDAGVYALDAATGERGWRLDAGTKLLKSPVVSGELLIVVRSDGAIVALGDPATGEATPGATEGTPASADGDISGLPPCVAPRLRPDPLPTGEPATSLAPGRGGGTGSASLVRADLPTAPRADADAFVGILDTLEAMVGCDRPGRERELGGFFTDDYYRRMAIRSPGTDLPRLPLALQLPEGMMAASVTDLPDAVVLEDGRVAVLFWVELWREGELLVFVEQDGAWLIDEVVGVTEEPNQPRG